MEQLILFNIFPGETQQKNITVLTPKTTSDSDNMAETNLKTETETVLQNLSENTEKLYYRRLCPNEPFRCDGQECDHQCQLEAEYEMLSADNPEKPHYCKKHFVITAKSCSENGYVLEEILRDETDLAFNNDDPRSTEE